MAHIPLFPGHRTLLFPGIGKDEILFGSDFLKCFIDIFIHINFTATPRNKIKTCVSDGGISGGEKCLWQIVRFLFFRPFITCPVLSKTSLNYDFSGAHNVYKRLYPRELCAINMFVGFMYYSRK